MKIVLKKPLNIKVDELAKALPQFTHRKAQLGMFGSVTSELIRDDAHPEKSRMLLFDGLTPAGFTEIQTDYTEAEMANLLTKLPPSLALSLRTAFNESGFRIPQLEEKQAGSKPPIPLAKTGILRKTLKDVYVIGDGPGALTTAVKLKMKGVKDVTLVGLRFDSCAISTDYPLELFAELSKSIHPHVIKPSVGRHIKDVHRQLYQLAKKLKVKFLEGLFIPPIDQTVDQKLKIKLKDGSIIQVAADAVFDRTGPKCEVLNAINALYSEPVFTYQSIPLPHSHYAVLRTKLKRKSANEKLIYYKRTDISPVRIARGIAKLRQIGWPYDVIPLSYANAFPKKTHEKNIKMNFFTAIPAGWTAAEDSAKILHFIEILLEIYLDEKIQVTILPTKNPNKHNLSTFQVKPFITLPGFYLGDDRTPVVFPGFDSQATVPFFSNYGFRWGIQREDALMDALTVEKQVITAFDIDKYQKRLDENIARMTMGVGLVLAKDEEDRIKAGEESAPRLYLEAEQKCQPKDKPLIQARLDHIHAVKELQLIKEEKTGLKVSDPAVKQKLKKILLKLASAKQVSRDPAIEETLRELAECCKKAGNYLFSHNNTPDAITYYRMAVNCIKTHFAPKFEGLLLNLYSNLMIAYNKQDEVDSVLQMAAAAESLCSRMDPVKMADYHDKIRHNKALAMVKKCLALSKQAPINKPVLDEFIAKTKKAIDEVAVPSNLNKALEPLRKAAQDPETLATLSLVSKYIAGVHLANETRAIEGLETYMIAEDAGLYNAGAGLPEDKTTIVSPGQLTGVVEKSSEPKDEQQAKAPELMDLLFFKSKRDLEDPEDLFIAGLKIFPDDKKGAFEKISAAANKNHARAQFHLALMLAEGLGCEKDARSASEWLEKAFANGYSYQEADYTAMCGSFSSPERMVRLAHEHIPKKTPGFTRAT